MQRTVDEVKHSADKEAELIIAEAKARAVREVENTKRQEEMRNEIEQLKQLRANYFIRTRALIRSQEELLRAMEQDQRSLIEESTPVKRPIPGGSGQVIA